MHEKALKTSVDLLGDSAQKTVHQGRVRARDFPPYLQVYGGAGIAGPGEGNAEVTRR